MKGKERGERPEAMGEENHTTEKERQAAKKETRVKKKKKTNYADYQTETDRA